MAALLNELAVSPVAAEKLELALSEARDHIAEYVVPKPFQWKLGDVFAFSLSDGSCAYGQVVGELRLRGGRRKATCALFDHRTPTLIADVQAFGRRAWSASFTCRMFTSPRVNGASWVH